MDLFGQGFRKYLIIPLILYLVFAVMIFAIPGLEQGIDLRGGTLIVVRANTEIDSTQLKQLIESNYELTGLKVGSTFSPTGFGATIEFTENTKLTPMIQELKTAEGIIDSNPIQARIHAMNVINALPEFVDGEIPIDEKETIIFAEETLDKARLSFELGLQQLISQELNLGSDARFQIREVGSSLGESFWQDAILVSIISIILIIVTVFFFFREIVPSIAIIAAALFDIMAALALMALFGIGLSLATIPALLMLIGYSVDTDIMLTTRLLKRKEKTLKERANDALQTGLTMTGTTIIALLVLLTASYLYQMVIVFQISSVLLFGLIGDLISTWFMNAQLLLIYIEKKKANQWVR